MFSTFLRQTKVSNNGLQDIRALTKCTQLEYLCLDFTGITVIPPEVLSSLKSLTVFSAQWNQLTSLPETIGSLSSIQQLNFCNNKLATIPRTIKNLAPSLQLLSCLYTQPFLILLRTMNDTQMHSVVQFTGHGATRGFPASAPPDSSALSQRTDRNTT